MEELKKKPQILQLSQHKTLSDYVIVVPVEVTEPGVTSRATQFEDRPEVGLVVGVGPHAEGVEVGNTVFFGRFSHTQLTYDDVIYLIMRLEDIYCVAE